MEPYTLMYWLIDANLVVSLFFMFALTFSVIRNG